MTYKTKKNTGRKLETVLLFATIAVFVLLFLIFCEGGIWQKQEQVQPLSGGWYYI